MYAYVHMIISIHTPIDTYIHYICRYVHMYTYVHTHNTVIPFVLYCTYTYPFRNNSSNGPLCIEVDTVSSYRLSDVHTHSVQLNENILSQENKDRLYAYL